VHELVERHLRLVIHIGKGYERRLTHEEIMSIGALALTQAAARWEPGKASMYQWARRWITTALTKAVDASRAIRLPEAVANDAAHTALRIAEIEAELGRPLSAAERAEVAGKRLQFDELPRVATSLNEPLAPTDLRSVEALSYDDVLADDTALDPEEEAVGEARRNHVAQALAGLDDLEREVIINRFGFTGERETLAVLGKRFGVSAEAMRRIETTALAKLRHPAFGTVLDGLL
jgi:RNA polymerase primary sigma factor